MLISKFDIYFSYHVYMIYDSAVEQPSLDWNKKHSAQGFARQASSVNFGTLLQFGDAHVQVFDNDYSLNHDDERVINVPLKSDITMS